MATEPLSNEQTIEQALNNILGHTKDIANLMRAKEAAELAIRGGATEKATISAGIDLAKASGLTNRVFRDEKGQFRTLANISRKITNSFKTSYTSINSYNRAIKQATTGTQQIAKATKEAAKAMNFQYAIGRGKYASITPFQSSRARVAKWADFLSIGVDARTKQAALEAKNFNILGSKGIYHSSKYNFLQKSGVALGRIATGGLFGGGGVGALAALGLGASAAIVGAIGAQIAKATGDALKTSLASASLSMGMEARGATGWTTGNIASSIYGMRRMGLTTDAAMQALTQGQQLGLNQSQIRSAVAAQQALGLSNTLQKSQTLTRRMGWGNDPASYFRSLTSIMHKTGLSMEELSNATEEFASNLRGVMDPNMIRGLMSRYGELVKTKAVSWGEIANMAMAPQALAPNQQMAVAHFAKMGGYNFKHSSLLGQAYEIQRMGPNQMGNLLNVTRSALKGMTGGQSWRNLTDEQKYMFGNMVAPLFGLGDFYKLPAGEEIMGKLMSGNYTKEELAKWQEDSKSGTDLIATKMDAIQNPVNQINAMLAGWISNKVGGPVGDFAKSIVSDFIEKQKEPVEMKVTTINTTPRIGLVFEVSGQEAPIYSEANNVNKSF